MDPLTMVLAMGTTAASAGWLRERWKAAAAEALLAAREAESQRLEDSAALIEEERKILELVAAGSPKSGRRPASAR